MSHLFHIPHGLDDPALWVLVAFFLFMGFLVFLRAPKMLAKALDDRAAAISKELEDAARMREEAQELLASFQRRQRRAEAEAQSIIEMARDDAERMAADMRASLKDRLERRAAMAERKIEQAEADAMMDVRRRASEVAAAAAEDLLREKLDASARSGLIDASIKELPQRFN